MTPATEVIVPVALFAMIFGIVYLSVTARHRQRMAMIDKGMDPRTLDDDIRTLKWGLLLGGVGVGLLLGHVLVLFGFVQDPENPLPYFIMTFIGGGSGLVAHHLIVRKRT